MIQFKYLFSEDGKKASIGRFVLWILLTISIYFWFTRPYNEFPETLFYTLIFVLIYNLSKKGFRILEKFILKFKLK